MAKNTDLNKWRSIKSESLRNSIAAENAKAYGRLNPTSVDFERANEILTDRKQFHILILSNNNSLANSFLIRKLEQESFSVGNARNFEEAKGMVGEANLILVDESLSDQINDIRKIRESYEYEKLPIVVFSNQKKPEGLSFIDWMPLPPFPEIVRRVVRQWSDWSSSSFMSAFNNPLDSLLTDMMINIDRFSTNHDKSLEKIIENQFKVFIEHAPVDLKRFGVQLYFAGTKREGTIKLPGLETLSGISTDRVYTLGELTEKSQPWCLKLFKNKKRALVEIRALKELESRQNSNTSFSHLLTPVNSPKLLVEDVLGYVRKGITEYYVVEEYIQGPMIYSIISEINEKLAKNLDEGSENDRKLAEFLKKAIYFVKNEQIAALQENPLDIGDVIKQEKTDFLKEISKNLTQNLQFFRVKLDSKALSCLDLCVEVLYSSLSKYEPVQYFDFNDTNLLLDIQIDSQRSRRAKFTDIKNEFKRYFSDKKISYQEMKNFVSERLIKIDFNKIYRNTHFLEDFAHEFSNDNWTEQERKQRFVHFLLCKEKEKLTKKIVQGSLNAESLENRKKIMDLIGNTEKLKFDKENAESSDSFLDKALLSVNGRDAFIHDLPLVQLYRTIRWFGHVLRKYIPEHRIQMEYATLQMRELFSDYENYFGKKRGFELERLLGKYLVKNENNDKRHFLSNETFVYDLSKNNFSEAVGPRLNDFISAANLYVSANQDFRHDFNQLNYYFDRAIEIADLIISGKQIGQVPALNDSLELEKYENQLKNQINMNQTSLLERNREVEIMAASFIQKVIKECKIKGIRYEKLIRRGVQE